MSQIRVMRFFPFASRVAMAAVLILAFSSLGYAQSTFGTVLGTLTDASGGAVPKAKVELINAGTNTVRTTESSANGNYQFSNIDIGTYRIRITASGFQTTEFQAFDLTARETRRVDASVQVATQSTTVTVEGAVTTIQTDASNISVTKGSRELTDLPVAIGTRSTGSTSAFATLTAQPGVQTDASNNIMVAGALPDMISITIDGISAVKIGSNAGNNELFPSFYSIQEIKIGETLNPAEFGGVADITTISKSGTNTFRGGLFENLQNTNMNAASTFSHKVAAVKMNNFGGYLGGRIFKDKTFFFGSYEVLRLPRSVETVLSVPTQAMRDGDLRAYDGTIVAPSQISPFSRKLMNLFMPLPNFGAPGALDNNFLTLYSLPINSTQGDIRLDHVISAKHLVYVRYTHKNKRQLTQPATPLLGAINKPALYNAFTAAHNWIISPTMVNELRGGTTRSHFNVSAGYTTPEIAARLGITSPPLPNPLVPGSITPTLNIAGYTSYAGGTGGGDQNPIQTNLQIADALTWSRGKHTIKFGGDYRYLQSLYTQVFGSSRLGNFVFNGSNKLGFSRFGGFLRGYPDRTTIAAVPNDRTDAYSRHWTTFVQDDWKVSRSLTINYGLRWEYNPGYRDRQNNIFNWYENMTTNVNGRIVRGAVIMPNEAARKNIHPDLIDSLNGTPIILASSVGLPETLSTNTKRNFLPRIGLAYRLGDNNKTVIRGGYGRFVQALQGARANYGWATGTNLAVFQNSLVNGTPVFSTPYSYPAKTGQPGTLFFSQASVTEYKDPIVEQWNLTGERDLGNGIGVRASYDGNHSYNVPTLANTNQVRPNTRGFSHPTTQALQPFPQVANVQAGANQGFGNYQAGTISVKKRSSAFQFESSYVFTRNLSNVAGYGSGSTALGFPPEFGRQTSDYYNPGLDYGNLPFSRRHRFLTTFLYELPIGKGKTLLNNVSPVVNKIVGGFTLSGVMVFQSGPFLSVTTDNDPSGTGMNSFNANGGRADYAVGKFDPYAGQSLGKWINPAAFINPANDIGRFGTSLSGAVQGPGTQAIALSLLKSVSLTERVRVEIGAQISNLFNHPNYAPPGDLTMGHSAFGRISSLQVAEGTGPRQVQLTARLTF